MPKNDTFGFWDLDGNFQFGPFPLAENWIQSAVCFCSQPFLVLWPFFFPVAPRRCLGEWPLHRFRNSNGAQSCPSDFKAQYTAERKQYNSV